MDLWVNELSLRRRVNSQKSARVPVRPEMIGAGIPKTRHGDHCGSRRLYQSRLPRCSACLPAVTLLNRAVNRSQTPLHSGTLAYQPLPSYQLPYHSMGYGRCIQRSKAQVVQDHGPSCVRSVDPCLGRLQHVSSRACPLQRCIGLRDQGLIAVVHKGGPDPATLP